MVLAERELQAGGERASGNGSICSTGIRSGGSGFEGSKGRIFVTETKAGPETLKGEFYEATS